MRVECARPWMSSCDGVGWVRMTSASEHILWLSTHLRVKSAQSEPNHLGILLNAV